MLKRENGRARYYETYVNDKYEDIIRRYDVDLSDYENLVQYDAEAIETIWQEIHREEEMKSQREQEMLA